MLRQSRPVLALAGPYALALLLIGLWPTHVDKNVDVVGFAPVRWMANGLGLDPNQAYDVVQVGANVALFVPLGVFAMLLWPRLRWGHAVLLGFLLTSAIELAQQLTRPERTASLGDVVANTAGAAVGAALIVALRTSRRLVRS